MKIVIDTRWLGGNNSGVGNYIKNLLLNIEKQTNPFEIITFGETSSGFENIPLKGLKKKLFQGLWKYLKYPSIEFLTGKFDLYHFTNMVQIPCNSKRKIITVHDLSFIKYPWTVERKNLKYLNQNAKWSIQDASHIIAVSNTTKEDIIKYYNIDDNKISVIYHGADDFYKNVSSQSSKEKIKDSLCIKKPFLLSVSTLEPRKDFKTLIEGYAQLNKNIRNEYDLFIVGGEGWGDEKSKLESLIEKFNLKSNIRLLGYKDRNTLKVLFDLASLYLHTSIDEGFGLSLLDAICSNLPIIASDTSCHPEILKNAALFFEPSNPQDLAYKIELLIIDKERRKNILDKSKDLLKIYNWEETAFKTLELYKKVLLETR